MKQCHAFAFMLRHSATHLLNESRMENQNGTAHFPPAMMEIIAGRRFRLGSQAVFLQFLFFVIFRKPGLLTNESFMNFLKVLYVNC